MKPATPSRSAALAAGPILALLLAACGSSTPSASPDAPTAAPPTEAATPSPAATASPSPDAATPSPEASPTDGDVTGMTGRIVDETNGVAVTLPDGWVRVDLSVDDIREALGEAGGLDPEAAAQLEAQLQGLTAAGLSLFAVDTEAGTDAFATNMNVLSLPSGGLPLDTIEELNVQQLRTLPNVSGEVTSERVTLPAGEAVYLSYALETTTAGGETVAPEVHQYLIVAGDTQHIVTFTGLDAPDLAADARAAAESFELVP